jgi:hypothetical protein
MQSSASWRLSITTESDNPRRPSIQTTELRGVAKRLGKLAVARYRQAGEFRIRQREQLRRALQNAGRALNWDVVVGARKTPVDEVTVDVRRLTQAGLKAIEKGLESEITEKRNEIRRLKGVARTLRKLADENVTEYPIEIAYSYTTSDGGKGKYVTKTKELQVEDPGSAEEAARKLEQQMERLGRLRDEMVQELEKKKQVVGQARVEVREFVRGTRPLIGEVLAVLY